MGDAGRCSKDANVETQGCFVFDVPKSDLKHDVVSVSCNMFFSGHQLPLNLRSFSKCPHEKCLPNQKRNSVPVLFDPLCFMLYIIFLVAKWINDIGEPQKWSQNILTALCWLAADKVEKPLTVHVGKVDMSPIRKSQMYVCWILLLP